MRARRFITVLGVAALTVTSGITAAGAASETTSDQANDGADDRASDGAKAWDFTGDGTGDLVVQASRATVDGHAEAGALAMFEWTEDGPSREDSSRLDQGSDLIPGTPEEEARFGTSTISGDFDGDGHADLAHCARNNAGDPEVTVVFGSPGGLTSSITIPLPDDFSVCGTTQAADANADGHDDLFMTHSPGGVALAHGGPEARDPESWQFEIIDPRREDGTYGLVVGDITGNGYADVVHHGPGGDAQWHVFITLGGPDGYTEGQRWSRTQGALTPALGDVDGDGHDDLVLGLPGDTVDGEASGSIMVYSGTPDGINRDDNPVQIDQSTPGMPGTPEQGDRFGATVALGDTTGNGHADIAIAVPGEDLGDIENAGRVALIPGSPNGPNPAQTEEFHKDQPDIPGNGAHADDQFGDILDIRNLSPENHDDLYITSPGSHNNQGLAYLLSTNNIWAFAPQHANINPNNAQFGR